MDYGDMPAASNNWQ